MVYLAKSPQARVSSCRGMFSQGHVSKLSDMFSQGHRDGNYTFTYTWWLIVVIKEV